MASKKKRVLDESRPYGTISSLKPRLEVYEQDGIYYDGEKNECGKVEGYDERKAAAANAAKTKSEAKEKIRTVQSAAEILGDLDGAQDAAKENQAAARAEDLADDA